MPTFHPLKVSEIERTTSEAVVISFEVPDQLKSKYSFSSGQYISLEAEILELKAFHEGDAQGVVIESELDKFRGATSTFLVQNGCLNVGDVVISGMSMGKVKAITNSSGEKIKQAGPSSAVEVLGLDTAPNAGSFFQVVKNEKAAREVIDFRESKQKEKLMASTTKRIAMWACPRTVSTALLRSFCQHSQVVGVDEPLYAYYLKRSGKLHPMRGEVMASQAQSVAAVVDGVLRAECDKPVQYVKHMAHHLFGDEDLSFKNVKHPT